MAVVMLRAIMNVKKCLSTASHIAPCTMLPTKKFPKIPVTMLTFQHWCCSQSGRAYKNWTNTLQCPASRIRPQKIEIACGDVHSQCDKDLGQWILALQCACMSLFLIRWSDAAWFVQLTTDKWRLPHGQTCPSEGHHVLDWHVLSVRKKLRPLEHRLDTGRQGRRSTGQLCDQKTGKPQKQPLLATGEARDNVNCKTNEQRQISCSTCWQMRDADQIQKRQRTRKQSLLKWNDLMALMHAQ